jgi:hypothetical protein
MGEQHGLPTEPLVSDRLATVNKQVSISRYLFNKLWERLSSRPCPWPLPQGVVQYVAQDAMLQQARAVLGTLEAKDLHSLVVKKIECLRHFNIPAMERAVAIVACGRSGSYLLYSYLDGHDDVMLLLPWQGDKIYQFFDFYKSLSLHDKLISYPIFAEFFEGDFRIPAATYYAAVNALRMLYAKWSPDFLQSSRAFFLCLHVAYYLALDRIPASSHPLIVYSQHYWNPKLARRFVHDFPHARFIHTVRDPITNCVRLYANSGYLTAPYTIRMLNRNDKPHPEMESRTRAVRFEDLHLHLETTMTALAEWLRIPHRSSLHLSTFNGVPWAVTRETHTWSGSRPEQAVRDTRHLSFTDRSLLFAVLNEDFVAWSYPYPELFKHRLVRALTVLLFVLIPMKIEIMEARAFFANFPPLRRGGIAYAINGVARMVICRLAVMALLVVNLCRRLACGKTVLEPISKP